MQNLHEVCARHNLIPPVDAYPGGVYRLDDPEKIGQGDGYLYLFADGAGGFVQNHRNADRGETWFYGGRGIALTDDQRKELRKQREAHKRQRESLAQMAVGEVLAIWNHATPAPADHPYLVRKRVTHLAPLLRVVGHVPPTVSDRPRRMLAHMQGPILIAPSIDIEGNPMTAEYIDATGGKRYHPDGSREAALMLIPGGEWFGGPVYVCEGVSTGGTIGEATGRPVVVTFDAGNMPKVADALRRKYPGVMMIIAADDDIALERAKKPNKGLQKAHEAAEQGRAAAVMIPDFTSLRERGDWSDFNDMGTLCGLQAVRDRLDISAVPSRVCPGWLKDDPLSEFRLLGYHEADIGAAFARLRAADMRYVHEWGTWLEYRNGVWQRERTEYAYDLIGQLCTEIINRGQNHNGAGSGGFLRKASTRKGAEQIARADRRIAAKSDQWDRDGWLLNTPGGVVDLRTGEMFGHRSDLHMTLQTAVIPDRDCHPDRWFRFLNEITQGQRELAAYLQRLVGYALTTDTREQMLALFYGEGANGKGTFIKTVTAIMGGYAKGSPIELFMEAKNDRHPTELANLKGARLVTSQEIDEGRVWSESRIKSLTGEDTITARYMRGDFFDFEPTHKLILSANNKPRFGKIDHAIRRRMQLVPFLAKFEGLVKDGSLKFQLWREAPGILQWMIDGALAWQESGLAVPAIVVDATKDYLDSEDLEMQWIEECCVREPQAEEMLSILFKSWVQFAGDRHGKMRRDRDLSDRLQREGIKRHKTMNGVMMWGIRLKRPSETVPRGIVLPFRVK